MGEREECGKLQFDHEKRISTLEICIQALKQRLKDVEEYHKLLIDMNSNIKVIAQRHTDLTKKMEKVEGDLEVLKGKPGKHWEQLTNTVITILVSGFMGAMINAYLK